MIVRVACWAMATQFEFLLAGEDEPRLRAAGEEALEEVLECERLLSRYARDSLVSHLGRVAAAQPVQLDDDTFAQLEAGGHRFAVRLFDENRDGMLSSFNSNLDYKLDLDGTFSLGDLGRGGVTVDGDVGVVARDAPGADVHGPDRPAG